MSDTATPHLERRTDTADSEPTVDDLLDVLTTERRRTLLTLLRDRQSPVDVEELATDVAARETDVAPLAVSGSAARDVHVTLHHVHLPKLADAGLVEYDPDDGTVAATDTTDAVPIDVE